jgi:hypothetical protein
MRDPGIVINEFAMNHRADIDDAQFLYPLAFQIDPSGELFEEAGKLLDLGFSIRQVRNALMYCESNKAEEMKEWIRLKGIHR